MTVKNETSIKIGSKILSDESLEIILPNYESIFRNIDEMRDKFEISNNYKNDEIAKHHDNIFGILGKRGSGKSSVLKTIESKLKIKIDNKQCEEIVEKNNETNKTYKNDIILPMIMPELMESDDLIGWLIGYFKKEVDRIIKVFNQKQYTEKEEIINKLVGKSRTNLDEFERCCYDQNMKCPVEKKYDSWVKAYTKRAHDYKEILKSKYVGEREYQRDFIEYLNADVNLFNEFGDFIDTLVEYIKVENYVGTQCKSRDPIIYVFFDDLDLIPYNSVKMLETIIIYLSHSNIITFIAGDYENFEERILLNYLRKDQILNQSLYEERNFNKNNNDRAIDNRRQLAYDFLKKLLTPMYRYNLTSFSREERFKFKSGEINTDEETKTLGDYLVQYSNIFKNNSNDKIGDLNSNFDIYSAVLDEKPRGLINIYAFLYEENKKSNLKELKLSEKKESLKRFIKLLIVCKDEYHLEEHRLLKCFKINESDLTKNESILEIQYNNIELICNYSQNDFDKDETNMDEDFVSRKSNNDRILNFYYLAFLLEQITNPTKTLNLIFREKRKEFEKFQNRFNNTVEKIDSTIFDFEVIDFKSNIKIYDKFDSNQLELMNQDIKIWLKVIKFIMKNDSENVQFDFKDILKFLADKAYEYPKWVGKRLIELNQCFIISDGEKLTQGYIKELIKELSLNEFEENLIQNSFNDQEISNLDELIEKFYPQKLKTVLKNLKNRLFEKEKEEVKEKEETKEKEDKEDKEKNYNKYSLDNNLNNIYINRFIKQNYDFQKNNLISDSNIIKNNINEYIYLEEEYNKRKFSIENQNYTEKMEFLENSQTGILNKIDKDNINDIVKKINRIYGIYSGMYLLLIKFEEIGAFKNASDKDNLDFKCFRDKFIRIEDIYNSWFLRDENNVESNKIFNVIQTIDNNNENERTKNEIKKEFLNSMLNIKQKIEIEFGKIGVNFKEDKTKLLDNITSFFKENEYTRKFVLISQKLEQYNNELVTDYNLQNKKIDELLENYMEYQKLDKQKNIFRILYDIKDILLENSQQSLFLSIINYNLFKKYGEVDFKNILAKADFNNSNRKEIEKNMDTIIKTYIEKIDDELVNRLIMKIDKEIESSNCEKSLYKNREQRFEIQEKEMLCMLKENKKLVENLKKDIPYEDKKNITKKVILKGIKNKAMRTIVISGISLKSLDNSKIEKLDEAEFEDYINNIAKIKLNIRILELIQANCQSDPNEELQSGFKSENDFQTKLKTINQEDAEFIQALYKLKREQPSV